MVNADSYPKDRPQHSRRSVVIGLLSCGIGACAIPHSNPAPFSAGTRRPTLKVPQRAVDSHIHIFDPRFPAVPGWRGEPVPAATVEAYRSLQKRLGTELAVLVTPSTYGADNRATLDALDKFGGTARGVIVIDCYDPPPDLGSMVAKGVTGIRVNFVSPQPWGRSNEERLKQTARIAADYGWHIQIYAKGEQILSMARTIAELPAPVVLDHLASIDPQNTGGSEAHRAVLRLLENGRTWMKLSGAYISSRTGAPSYEDVEAIAQSYVAQASDRMVWGSDWPHRGQQGKMPDDAILMDLLERWAPTRSHQQKILVDNPAQLYGFG